MKKIVKLKDFAKKIAKKLVEKIQEKDILSQRKVWEIGQQNVRAAMREGAAAGTCIGTTAIAIELFCCFAHIMASVAAKHGVYGPLDGTMIICQLLVFTGNAALGLLYAFAYTHGDYGDGTETRPLWTGDATQDALLREVSKFVEVVVASTGVLMALVCAIAVVLPVASGMLPKLPGLVIEGSVILLLVLVKDRFGDIVWEIGQMYIEEEQQRIRKRRAQQCQS